MTIIYLSLDLTNTVTTSLSYCQKGIYVASFWVESCQFCFISEDSKFSKKFKKKINKKYTIYC